MEIDSGSGKAGILRGAGFSVKQKDASSVNCSKKRGLASCYLAPVNTQVFEPAFESRVLFINREIEI